MSTNKSAQRYPCNLNPHSLADQLQDYAAARKQQNRWAKYGGMYQSTIRAGVGFRARWKAIWNMTCKLHELDAAEGELPTLEHTFTIRNLEAAYPLPVWIKEITPSGHGSKHNNALQAFHDGGYLEKVGKAQSKCGGALNIWAITEKGIKLTELIAALEAEEKA